MDFEALSRPGLTETSQTEDGPKLWPSPVPLPPGLARPEGDTPEAILKPFLGLPYRADGAADQDGRWVLWSKPEAAYASPGLNCSGFTLAAVRSLLGDNISLKRASADRQGDSGPGSEYGEDWDFGLDLILNLSEGRRLGLYPPPSGPALSQNRAGRAVGWGEDINGPGMPLLLSALPPGLYLAVISKPDRRFAGGLSYYHDGLLLASQGGSAWFYHSGPKGGVQRWNLRSPEGLSALRRFYPPPAGPGGERRMLLARLSAPPGAEAAGRSGQEILKLAQNNSLDQGPISFDITVPKAQESPGNEPGADPAQAPKALQAPKGGSKAAGPEGQEERELPPPVEGPDGTLTFRMRTAPEIPEE
jgi:hypothetical protein